MPAWHHLIFFIKLKKRVTDEEKDKDKRAQ